MKLQRAEALPVTGSLQRAALCRLFVRQIVTFGSRGDAVRATLSWLKRNPADTITVDGIVGAR